MHRPDLPEADPPVKASTLRDAVWAAARATLGGAPDARDCIERHQLRAFVDRIQDVVGHPLWFGETDVFHDNEPAIGEVVEALQHAADLYGVLIRDA